MAVAAGSNSTPCRPHGWQSKRCHRVVYVWIYPYPTVAYQKFIINTIFGFTFVLLGNFCAGDDGLGFFPHQVTIRLYEQKNETVKVLQDGVMVHHTAHFTPLSYFFRSIISWFPYQSPRHPPPDTSQSTCYSNSARDETFSSKSVESSYGAVFYRSTSHGLFDTPFPFE